MSNIGRRSDLVDRRSEERASQHVSRRLSDDLEVAVPIDILSPENLLGLLSVVRRPPELQLTNDSVKLYPGLEEVRSEELQNFSHMSTPDLGYRIASLLVRRESEVAESNDPFVSSGFAELEIMARMLEHLLIKRTSGQL